MIRRTLSLLVGALVLCGLVVADDAPKGEKEKPADPPRLKKKKRDGVPPVVDPEKAKDDTKEPPVKDGKGKEPPVKEGGKEPPVKEGKGKDRGKDEALQPEDDRGEPEEDDKDIIERINKRVRESEEKISNKELGEPLEQHQRDILKDIDSLINRKQQGGGGGGGGGGAQDNKDDKDNQDKDKGGGGGGGGGAQEKKEGGGEGGAKSRSEQRKQARNQQKQGQKNGGRQARREPRPQGGKSGSGGTKMASGKEQPKEGSGMPKPGGGGNNPGAGKGGPTSDKENPLDPTKSEWGHLPESLRAEMNAYSNPQPFMPRYDDLIRKYYRTIAEKGRSKGKD